MERQGLSSLTTLSDYRIPLRKRLTELGIQYVFGWVPGSADRLGIVYAAPSSVGAWGWVRASAPAAEGHLGAPRPCDRFVHDGHLHGGS
jgi:hypothetical protein